MINREDVEIEQKCYTTIENKAGEVTIKRVMFEVVYGIDERRISNIQPSELFPTKQDLLNSL